MLSTLLLLLGAVLTLISIITAVVFMIAGILRRSPVNIKVLAASGITGLLMIALGVLPWGIASVVGIVLLAVGGFIFFFFIGLPRYEEGKLKEELLKVREYIRREHIKPVLRFLLRTVMVVGVILVLNVIGLSVFLFSKGLGNLSSLTKLLTILLLLEGSLIGAGGAFMFVGYSEYRIARQGAINPAIVADQRRGWKERRLSQQKWGVRMIVAGVLLIILGLIVSIWTSL